MGELLIVDGYNIINDWSELKDIVRTNLEDARVKLLEKLQDYQGYKGIRVIVVFDAHMVKNSIRKFDELGDLEIVFTKENETADQYIERMVDTFKGQEVIRVATSDRVEQTIIFGRGAVRMSARELKIEVDRAEKERNQKYIYQPTSKHHNVENRLHSDLLAKLEALRREK